jgi:hypothetical protein
MNAVTLPLSDIWSAGCVLAELYIGEPLIYSLHNTADQLRLVYELFGTPTADDLKAMNVEMEALKPNEQQQSALDQLTKVQFHATPSPFHFF